ncbi:TetR/AcrR family transcriptional regulator [Paenibacillus roseipurpureus]|uniref:TetR/AcrR family transcriptional regulator n=1 Tax=Paenibacillus roseopurpureus TaxID=2918901 RepID=A0AA96RMD0_9BACL|nr:TetR/AcrR family transcriptional regulator [Paenibacillus sp. MBLB1832]WNR44077.1 TetR/AcrR family transcriptional regulator [Paenibacillus sp. MBLB1832]
MPRNIKKDQQNREERTAQILEAAQHVFARRGLLTKIQDIAEEAGLSHGHIYNYFASKEEILLKIIDDGQSLYEKFLLSTRDLPTNALEKLRLLLSKYMLSDRTAEIYLVILQAQATDLLPQEAIAKMGEKARSNLVILTEIIEQGQREGLIRQEDSVVLTTLFLTLMQNISLMSLRGFAPLQVADMEMALRFGKLMLTKELGIGKICS